jgi:WD40-like Beta Propeller Repeat
MMIVSNAADCTRLSLRYRWLLLPLLVLAAACGHQSVTRVGDAAATATSWGAPAAQLAYVRDGALWVTSVLNEHPRQLIGAKVSGWPRWSPSGTWLRVCVSDRLHLLSADGSVERALGPCGGRWMPPGDTLIYRDDAGITRQLSPGDGQERVLPEEGDAWSEDGATMLVVREQLLGTRDSANAPQRAVSLWRRSVDGSSAVEIFSPGNPAPYGIRVAGWYGDMILFWPVPGYSESLLADGTSLEALSASSGAPRTLVPAMLAREDFLARAPDGRLAVVDGADRQTWTSKRIAIIEPASGARMDVTPPDMAAVGPAWSPDGQILAYVAAPDGGPLGGGEPARKALAERRIWTVRADRTGAQPLTHDAAFRDEHPRWTADGQWIIFVRLDERDRVSLWRVRPDGYELAQIAGELGTGTPSDVPRWFGFYGAVDWAQLVDVHS